MFVVFIVLFCCSVVYMAVSRVGFSHSPPPHQLYNAKPTVQLCRVGRMCGTSFGAMPDHSGELGDKQCFNL